MCLLYIRAHSNGGQCKQSMTDSNIYCLLGNCIHHLTL